MVYKRTIAFLAFYLFIGVFFEFGQENDSIELLKKSLNENINDTTRLNTLIKLCDYYKSSNATIYFAKDYNEEAFLLCTKKKLKVPYKLNWIRAEILHALGMTYKAIDEMKIVLAELEKTNHFQEYANAWNAQAYFIHYSGQFRLGIETYQANIEYAKRRNLKSIIPQAYLGIANVYNIIKSPKEEKVNLIMFLEEAKKENNIALTALAYSRLGYYYSKIDSNYTFSIQQYKQSADIYKSIHDSLNLIKTINHLGWNFYLEGNLDSSLKYYLQALKYSPSNSITGIANAYENIGNIYRDKKDYKQALSYYNLCDEYCVKTHDLYNRTWLNKDISDMYIKIGDFKMAYQHFVNFKNFNDSLKSFEYNTGVADARTRYETETKEKELLVLNMKLVRHGYLIYGFAGLIILLLIIGFLIFRQSKMNAKRKLSEMNSKLSEITHANLRQQMNPHFIFNTLNSIQYYMYQHDKIATNNYLTKFSSLIRKILENSQIPFVSIKDELDVIKLYLELETLRFKEKFKFEIRIDEEIDTLSYKIPTMLIQPYIENAVCHGLMHKEESGLLSIEMSLNDDYILCIVEDNGIGRDAAMEIKNNRSISHNSLGIKITESRIDISNAIYGTKMKAVYTDLMDKEKKPCGTRVELYLPIMT